MKMNEKIFKNAKSTPFRAHKYNDTTIELHYLDDNDFYSTFIQKGRMYVWSSDGKDYRLFIDKGYYNAGERLFDDKINEIWIDYFNNFDEALKKIQKKYLLPGYIIFFVLFIGIFFLGMFLKDKYPDTGSTIYLVLMAILFIVSFVLIKKLNTIRSNAIEEERVKAEKRIKKYLGKKDFKDVLQSVTDYRDNYYKIDDIEVEEENKEDKEVNEDKKDIENEINDEDLDNESDDDDDDFDDDEDDEDLDEEDIKEEEKEKESNDEKTKSEDKNE